MTENQIIHEMFCLGMTVDEIAAHKSLHPSYAVSYTHLDVYKRQPLRFVTSVFCFTDVSGATVTTGDFFELFLSNTTA